MRRCLAWCVLALAGAPAMASEPLPVPSPAEPAMHASVAMDRQAIERAVAGSVVAALAERFGRAVEVRFGAIDVRAIDDGQRSIDGEGDMRFAGDPGWIGFRFRSVYDGLLGQAGPPDVEIGVGGDSRAVPNDSPALRQLEDRMADVLRTETGVVDIRMQLDRVETLEMGSHYLVMQAQGLADFGRDGNSDLHIHAIYDRRNGDWLQLDHTLGAAAYNRHDAALTGR